MSAEADAPIDDNSAVLPLVGVSCITAACLVVGLWLLKDLPTVLWELRRLVRNWAEYHEVARVVDCTPWGLEKKFVITQDCAPTVPGRKLEFGFSLWNGAVALSRLLAEQQEALRAGAFADDHSVLELGCGQPLVSMVAYALFPKLRRIVATDGCEDLLPAANSNIASNLGASTTNLEVAVLRWGREDDIQRVRTLNRGDAFDVILGADITYDEEHDDLVDTIVALAHSNTEVWITHEPRRRSTDKLVGRLRKEFRSVAESIVVIPPHGKGYSEDIQILAWHCTGKVAS